MPFPAPAGTYPTKDDVADYLRGYVTAFELRVRLSTSVTRLTRTGDTFVADTSTGTVTVGGGRRDRPVPDPGHPDPRRPPCDRRRPALHSADYRNPDQLPDGPVLVVGAGSSGLQIAAELAAHLRDGLAAARPRLRQHGCRPTSTHKGPVAGRGSRDPGLMCVGRAIRSS